MASQGFTDWLFKYRRLAELDQWVPAALRGRVIEFCKDNLIDLDSLYFVEGEIFDELRAEIFGEIRKRTCV